MVTNNAINTGKLAATTDVEAGTSTVLLVNPAAMQGYMSLLDFTGFVSWSAGGPYFDDTTLGTFKLLVGGTGYIQGQKITWVAQNITGLTAGNTYYIYIDSTGTIGKTPTRTDALFTDNIVLFECLRDSTPVTNNQVTVKENHPYSYPATTSNYDHNNLGTLIENNQGGANITLNGTQKIQINGADVLSDHGLETTIPDSASTAVTWNQEYTTAGGKWALYTASDTFTGFWNSAGTPTALTAAHYAVYTLYVSKDNLNAATPTYFAVLNTAQFTTLTAANTAITNGTTAKASGELQQLEICQLGYIIYHATTSSIVSVIISKTTLKSSTTNTGTNQASLVNVDTSAFSGWLGAGDTNVQQSLNDLDQVLIGGSAGQVALSQGAAAQPLYKTPTSGTGTTVTTNATTLSWALSVPVSIANGGTNATSLTTTDGAVCFDGTRLATTSVTTSGYVLTNNASGLPEFKNSASSTKIVVQKFTYTGSPQTYTPTSGMLYCEIEALGGGGGGGGAAATNGSQTAMGGAGGGGGYAKLNASAATIGSSQTITIGIGGPGGNTGNGTGGNQTTVGALLTCNGGNGGGAVGPYATAWVNGATGGTASGGDTNITGQAGASSIAYAGQFYMGGNGADSQYGSGGVGSGGSTVGNNATGYGAGGSGAVNGTSQSAKAGGNGSAGLVIITEYILVSSVLGTPINIASGGTDASSFSTTNGLVKFDGTRLVSSTTATLDASNRYTNSSQPCFFAFKTAPTNSVTGNGATYTIIFDSANVNNGTIYNTSTGTFTVPVTGNYFLYASCLLTAVTSVITANLIIVPSSGPTLWAGESYAFSSNLQAYLNVSGILSLTATQTVTVTIAATGQAGNNCTLFGAAAQTMTSFGGYLIC